jgi:cyanophycin synthetase
MITIYDNGAHIPLLWTHLIPATLEGKALHNVQNAMFAAAMAYCGGVKLEDIRHGLRTFDTTFFQAPGRMNVFDGHPFRVILDYAHNPHAIEAMCDVVDQFTIPGRKIVVLAAPGDRRDEDITAIATNAAGHFDFYLCRRDDGLRGRGETEVPEMLRDALLGAGIAEDAIRIVPSEIDAVDAVLRMAESDDLILIFGDALTRTWNQITQFGADPDRPTAEADSQVIEAAELPELPSDEVQLGGRVMRDERGVYLAPELND